MNENQVEKLLRKAPRIPPPHDLQARLKSDASRLLAQSKKTPRNIIPIIKRLIPIAACVLAISTVAIQGAILRNLKNENATLHSTLKALQEKRRAETDERTRLQVLLPELDRMRNDRKELQQLRLNVEQLRNAAASLEKLRAENVELKRTELATSTTNSDFFAQQKMKAESIMCVNNMKQICLGGRLWASDNNGIYPKTFAEMKEEVGSPKAFFCPVDAEMRKNATMADIDQGRSSYVYVSPEADEREPEVVVIRCPHHGHVGLADGSVQGGVLKRNYRIGQNNKLERQ